MFAWPFSLPGWLFNLLRGRGFEETRGYHLEPLQDPNPTGSYGILHVLHTGAERANPIIPDNHRTMFRHLRSINW